MLSVENSIDCHEILKWMTGNQNPSFIVKMRKIQKFSLTHDSSLLLGPCPLILLSFITDFRVHRFDHILDSGRVEWIDAPLDHNLAKQNRRPRWISSPKTPFWSVLFSSRESSMHHLHPLRIIIVSTARPNSRHPSRENIHQFWEPLTFLLHRILSYSFRFLTVGG